jgi:AAT family amino acid transporter
MTQFNHIMERESGLRRDLSSAQLSMIAIGAAIGTGLFLGSGFAIGFAGPSVLVSYGFGAVIALLLMGCLAEMTAAHPTAGSFGSFAEHYVGPFAGFAVRYAYWASLVLAIGTEVTAIAIYMRYWFPAVPGWYWITGFSLALVGINLINVRLFGNVEYTFSFIKISTILLFIVLGARLVFTAPPDSGVGFSNYVSHGGFFPKGLSGTWAAVIPACFSYLGIEMIAVAAGEARDPEKAVGRAFRLTLVRLLFFYILTLGLMMAIIPWPEASTRESPFVKVMEATHVPGAASLINFVVLVAALSAMNSQLYTATRMMFSLARGGQAPRFFGVINSRGIPAAALGISSIGIGIAVLLSIFFADIAFAFMNAVSIFGGLFAWLMIFVTHLFFRARSGGLALPFRMWGYPFTSLLGAAIVAAVMGTTWFVPQFKSSLIYGLPFLAVLALLHRFALPARDRARERPTAMASSVILEKAREGDL